jgi:glycosyltransferase involved in cell wall biosynthesis
VEGSKTKEDAIKNKECIDALIYKHSRFQSRQSYGSGRLDVIDMQINYVNSHAFPNYTDNKLSDLRNIGNAWCSGDIIICMDDDDYYPPERIEHAVNCLMNSSKLIAGCSPVHMYEYDMQKLYKFDCFGENHSTNNCFAYKRKYLENHSHAPGLSNGEELSFTNKFSEPMIQLNSNKTIVVSSHNNNTFNKKDLCISGSAGMHDYLHEVSDIPVTEFIPIPIFDKMKLLFDNAAMSLDCSSKLFCNKPSFMPCTTHCTDCSCNNKQIDIEHAWRM